MKASKLLVAVLAVSSFTSALRAEDLSEGEEETHADRKSDKDAAADSSSEPDDFGHGQQFGLRAALVAGYRMVLRYDESPYCRAYDPTKSDSDQVKFCGHGGPLAVDLGLSFAPFDFVEPFIWTRLGFSGEEQTDTEPLVIIGAGARIYTMSDSAFKIYVEPALGLELEKGQGNQPWARFDYRQDIVFHLAAGPQLDLARNVGVYVDAGLTMGILRAIHSSLELKAGVQARLP